MRISLEKKEVEYVRKVVEAKLYKQNRGESQGGKAFRQYDKTITKSLAEDPTDAGIFFEVDAVRNHKSTRLCSCRDGSTG